MLSRDYFYEQRMKIIPITQDEDIDEFFKHHIIKDWKVTEQNIFIQYEESIVIRKEDKKDEI